MTNLTCRFITLLGLALATIPSLAATVSVDIIDNQFQTGTVTVLVGDTVKWTNTGINTHTTTEDTKPVWDSSFLSNGASFSFKFTTPGTFNYHCNVHPFMTAKVIVLTLEQKIGKKIINEIPKILPIKLNLAGKNINQVYQGSYIVNAQSGCADCHSCPTYTPGHNPYKGEPKQLNPVGYLAGGVAFGPPGPDQIVSRNLTRDANDNPAGLTLAQFKSTLRTGHSPHEPPTEFLEVMPWPLFGMMSDRDLEAIYAYLKSIPKAQPPAQSCATPGQ